MGVEVRTVNRRNLKEEFLQIGKLLRRNEGSYVSVDTEFPGTVFKQPKPYYSMSLQENYACMRENVNNLKLIQLGLTVCDHRRETVAVWEFNFKDFNVEKDFSDPTSIALLKSHGLDFARNRKEGISGAEFAVEFVRAFCGSDVKRNLTWVFFHCTYDLGYLIKILTRKPLPENVVEFMGLVQNYLGGSVFDVKEMVKALPFEWNCGLNKVAQTLGIQRLAGRSHQAGSDSLLTLLCFVQVMDLLVPIYRVHGLDALQIWSNQLHGLPSVPVPVYQLPGFGVEPSLPVYTYAGQDHPGFVPVYDSRIETQ